jgi:membrane dipeptidase
MLTLTWNGTNEIGDGSGVDNPKGLTEFGKNVISEMEKNNIIIDISHASDKLFYDVAELTTKPFVASHSNSRFITPHKRNLTDDQIKIIIERKGLFGLNFHNKFLSQNYKKSCMFDILKHTEHFLSLGGENCISFGTDFDGCDLPNDINSSQSMNNIYEMFLKHNYKESLIKKIFYENALIFFENFDN